MSDVPSDRETERALRVLALATFVVFFQAYMVAPIIPQLAAGLGATVQETGSVVAAYLLPYGIATLFYGVLADRIGLRPVMLGSLVAFVALNAATASAQTLPDMIAWRAATGLGASGIVPLALVLVGRAFPFERRGRPLGWLFGAMAGGMAFGSTLGGIIEGWIGWRALFLIVSVAGTLALVLVLPLVGFIGRIARPAKASLREVFAGYRELMSSPRGRRTYAYVFLNAVFHSGVFTWLGTLFQARYHLGPGGVGFVLLGYGVPGLLFGPLIGHVADRRGRARLLPFGLAIGALAAVALAWNVPLVVAALLTTLLSLGYDMTQPLFAGIVTTLGKRPGLAMGLNVFMLFVGFGVGSVAFDAVLEAGFGVTLVAFGLVELLLALVALPLFRTEVPSKERP